MTTPRTRSLNLAPSAAPRRLPRITLIVLRMVPITGRFYLSEAGCSPYNDTIRSRVRGMMAHQSAKRVSETQVQLAQLMQPTDANVSGNVHGGTLMKLADTAGALVAVRHSGGRVVTVVMDSMT